MEYANFEGREWKNLKKIADKQPKGNKMRDDIPRNGHRSRHNAGEWTQIG